MRFRIDASARRHGIADADIKHAVDHAMRIIDQKDDLRLYLGPTRNAGPIEVVTVMRIAPAEIAIHAMKMRSKYSSCLSGE
jgi:hypothetical protein